MRNVHDAVAIGIRPIVVLRLDVFRMPFHGPGRPVFRGIPRQSASAGSGMMPRSITLMIDAPSLNAWHRVRSRLLFAWFVIAAPAIVTSVLLYVLFGKTLLDHFSVWSDEIAYQHQIATFVRAGFSGGYFSFEE